MARKHHKAKRGYRGDVESLEMSLTLNGSAQQEGRKRKKWTMHDLRSIKPLTPNQEDMFHAFFSGKHICASGSAGTGKTFLALYLALSELLDRRTHQKIIIVRSAVTTREVGHLPGSLEEKMSEYERPYREITAELVGRCATYDDMKEAGLIEFMATSFIRGITWDNAIVVVDEGENMNFHEIDSIMTRLGKNSKVIFTGDVPQTDLLRRTSDATGMPRFLKVVENMSDFASIKFTRDDIVRSNFVKSWIIASEDTPN